MTTTTNYNVAVFSEMGFTGKIPQTHDNMRVEFAWMAALEATHHPLGTLPSTNHDVILVLNSKSKPHLVDIQRLKKYSKLVCILQEGPHWGFQDYSVENQIRHFNQLSSADLVFAHNTLDRHYYSGLLNNESKVKIIRSTMFDDTIKDHVVKKENKVMIGGNFVSWYGGFDSYIIAQEFETDIYAPSMGRKQTGEEQLVNLLPYMNWTDWMKELSKYTYAVHLMRTHAAGTFAMNCAYWGIPCIGYRGLDTQENLHKYTTVTVGNLVYARELANRLKTDPDFYELCSTSSKKSFDKYCSIDAWKKHFHSQLT